MAKWFDKLVGNDQSKVSNKNGQGFSFLRSLTSGSFYKMSDLRGDTSVADIHTQIETMRALARDSQISTALSYYATDATVPNSKGQIIWATVNDESDAEIADIINALFKKWNLDNYVRDHILELATIGNLYIPTTNLYRTDVSHGGRERVSLDGNSIKDDDFDIVPSYKIPPEDIIHIWYQGKPEGFILQPDDEGVSIYTVMPESSIIHFSLGGLLGEYTFDATSGNNGDIITYDIQFAQPLMEKAVQPTQTLSLLEDSVVLSSLTRIVKFINVECGNAEEAEIQATLQQIKDVVEQQLSLNTASGDVQSYVNPQSPNNLIYLPKVNGQEAISITDLNMTESSETENKLLQYYQDKKLSVLGVPKEAMNFSSAEGLGNAGTVMSQRSEIYANALRRLETAYINGWTDAINKYFIAKGLSGFVDKFELHMEPILTEMSSINFEKRDSAIGQAQAIVDLMLQVGIEDKKDYKNALVEILTEVLPTTGNNINQWDINVENGEGDGLDEI